MQAALNNPESNLLSLATVTYVPFTLWDLASLS